jgi:hypothetical protein
VRSVGNCVNEVVRGCLLGPAHWQADVDLRSLSHSSMYSGEGPETTQDEVGFVRRLLRKLQLQRGLPMPRLGWLLLTARPKAFATLLLSFTPTRASTCSRATSMLSWLFIRQGPWARAIGHLPPTSAPLVAKNLGAKK